MRPHTPLFVIHLLFILLFLLQIIFFHLLLFTPDLDYLLLFEFLGIFSNMEVFSNAGATTNISIIGLFQNLEFSNIVSLVIVLISFFTIIIVYQHNFVSNDNSHKNTIVIGNAVADKDIVDQNDLADVEKLA